MRVILTLRHWQIFLLLLAFYFAIIGLLTLTQFELPEIPENFIFSWITMTVYPLLLGLGLYKYVVSASEKAVKEFKTFIIFCSIWTVAFFCNEMLKSQIGMEDSQQEMHPPSVIVRIVALLAYLKFIQFPSRTINSIELKREAGLWEYVADSFQILCWPLCIWWIQPRINRIHDKKMKTGQA
ncbi:hypothetical protein SAMN04488109_4398 [Chryseolinea serpens]|uniref:Uncharacterized protein n=1 Tax=Chryseolinea serpens TaxID=947013 RepID=A0A1M5U118_9BACT|nr:hypothetical protein [Chryseolinea serpens]SHH56722.1 hypothetical protein SAMN04488109_4398 [Chryseolinea serpens]